MAIMTSTGNLTERYEYTPGVYLPWRGERTVYTRGWQAGDTDHDGDCDEVYPVGDDFLAVNNFFGFNANPGLAFVPEPSAISIFMVVGLTPFRRARPPKL